MGFGKPGRPPEDRVLRQREIYLAVAPLLDEVGYRGLSMQAAARAAHLSIGGLYHYFPTKRDLVLHPLSPEFGARYCADLTGRYAPLATSDPERYARLKIQGMARVVSAARPAFRAAVEMGGGTFQSSVELTLERGMEAFEESVMHIDPPLDPATVRTLVRSLRRTLLAGIVDRSTTEAEMAAELDLLITVHLGRVRTRSAA